MAYDPVVQKTVLIGGRSQMTGMPDYPEDAWTWDGAVWTQLTGAPHLDFPFASFDPMHQVVVVFGFGPGAEPQTSTPQTWTWDGSTWVQKTASHSPSVESSSAMCFDRATAKVLLYGGVSESVSGGVSNSTWLWDGSQWSQVVSAHNPGPRFDALLACGSQTMLFGGRVNQMGAPGTGTWIWDGTDWQEVSSRLPDDCCGAVVYDGSRYIMFETGRDGLPVWQWSGADWNKVA